MSDRILARSRMAEIEDRIGVRPIEELLAERQTATEAVAVLRARHGPFGTWDHERKTLLATLRMKARAIATGAGTKVTEAWLDDAAHASPEYMSLVTIATRERSDLTLLEAKVDAIDALIRRGQSITHYLAAESRLTP